MSAKIIPNIHQLAIDVWLVETPARDSGWRTVSLHLLNGGKHIWLWCKLAMGAGPTTAFPQFQLPCPALEDSEIHRNALPEMISTQEFNGGPVVVGSQTFEVCGDQVKASGFAETSKTLTVELRSNAPVFRWE